MQRARRGGVGSPKGNRWRNANARTNAAQGNAAEPSLGSRAAHFNAAQPRRAEGIPLAEGEPEGRTSGGATAIQPSSWDDSRTSPSARIAEL